MLNLRTPLSPVHRQFLAAGGTPSYGLEKTVKLYYDATIWKTIHGAVNFQYIHRSRLQSQP